MAGIGWLPASSPEAKGRVERLWGTLQDRLVLELRLEGITTIADANRFLPAYLDRHNARFSVPAADPEPAWRPWPEGRSAEAVFAFWYGRTVNRDNTLAWGQDALAVPRRADGRTRAGQRVTLAERLDGSLWAELDGRWEPLAVAPPSAPVLRARAGARTPASTDVPAVPVDARTESDATPPGRARDGRAKEPWRPAADHPWRRGYKPR